MTRGPSVRIQRLVEWMDTDAAGHYHHSSVIRWAEAAEAELLRELGLPDLVPLLPRVRYEVDYLDRLYFRDTVLVDLWVDQVGTSSLRYGFELTREGHGPAARGAMTCVQADPETGGSAPWPPEVAQVLGGPAPHTCRAVDGR